ncbi:MAG: hypothetical protein FWC51_01340 [Proteobacteria bacterium]|nr:hypothetical protein [Pseudomonadota bacterium]
MNKKDYALSEKITRLGNRGVNRAVKRAHRADIPVPRAVGEKIVYLFADGSVKDDYKYPKVLKIGARAGS